MQDRRHCAHGKLALVLGENLEETAHVGSLEVVRKTHGQRQTGCALLLLVLAIENNDRIRKIAHPDLIDGDLAAVRRRLNVRQFCGGGNRHGYSSYSAQDELVSQTRTRLRRTESLKM